MEEMDVAPRRDPRRRAGADQSARRRRITRAPACPASLARASGSRGCSADGPTLNRTRLPGTDRRCPVTRFRLEHRCLNP